MENQKLYYSLAEVRKIIFANTVSKSTINAMIKKDLIPHTKVMTRILVPRWWIDEQIRLATVAPKEAN